MSSFKVTISSRFEELWRYNIVAVCELCSADGKRIEYNSAESIIAPVGSNLTTPPIDYDPNRSITLKSQNGDFVNILAYIIPHTLPSTSDIHKTKPFHLTIKVEADKEILLNQVFEINQWSGDNITLEGIGKKE